MKTLRLIRSGAGLASQNMELDAQIYKRYLEEGAACLRLYSWARPAFTYGFSQEPANLLDLELCAKDGMAVVKRITGGGLLFHDREITYSFVCSKSDIGEAREVFVDYRNICRFLTDFYRSLGLNPSFALESAGFAGKSAAHEICSASFEKYDIVLGAKKIGGNAQKRSRQAIFQHGSIPLNINWELAKRYVRFWPEGLEERTTFLEKELAQLAPLNILEEKLIESFGRAFNLDFVREDEAALVE